MRITVLVENNSRIDNYLLAEPALSFYLELNGKKVLFDCGYSDIFIYPCHYCDLNAKIELSKHFKIKEVCTGDVIKFC